MVCPECGEPAHRSHSRSFQESMLKKVSSYKTYRCAECGWRGMAAPTKGPANSSRWKMILFWVAGLIIALIIGIFAVYDLHSSILP